MDLMTGGGQTATSSAGTDRDYVPYVPLRGNAGPTDLEARRPSRRAVVGRARGARKQVGAVHVLAGAGRKAFALAVGAQGEEEAEAHGRARQLFTRPRDAAQSQRRHLRCEGPTSNSAFYLCPLLASVLQADHGLHAHQETLLPSLPSRFLLQNQLETT